MTDQVWNGRPQPGGPPGTRIIGTGDAAIPEDKACLTRAQPQLMFRLFFRDGRRRSIQYFNLVEHEYQSGLLRVYCHECTVTILGRRLQEMDDLLSEHKVYAFVEQHKSEFRAEANQEPFIDKITIGTANLSALGRNPA